MKLVAQRLGALDQRPNARHEVSDGLGHGAPRAQDDPRARVGTRRGDGQDAALHLRAEQLDQLVEGGLSHFSEHGARALGQLLGQGRDAPRHLVQARALGHDGDRSMTRELQPGVEAGVLRQDDDGHDGGGRVARELLQDGLGVLRSVAQQDDEIRRRRQHGGDRVLGSGRLDEGGVPPQRLLQRRAQRVPRAQHQQGRKIAITVLVARSHPRP